jgi:hypothetical protein
MVTWLPIGALYRRTMTPRCAAFVWDGPLRPTMSLSTATLSIVLCVFIRHVTESRLYHQKANRGCVTDARLLQRRLW